MTRSFQTLSAMSCAALIGALVAPAGSVSAQCQSAKSAKKASMATCTWGGGNSAKASTCSWTADADRPDIVDTALAADGFNTLVAAVKAAGLVQALKGDGPFTVFAPTDEAFAKLPAGTLQTLLKPENKAMLQGILTYHVVPAPLTASDVTRKGGATTLNGQSVDFKVSGQKVMVDGARVVQADIMCGNGVIHVIDSVILPSSDDIVATASSAGRFNTLLTAATKAGLAEALQGEGPFTILAPTDEAFDNLPKGTLQDLLKPANRQMLADILKFHVIPARVTASDAIAAGMATTLQGGNVWFDIRNGRLVVNGAAVTATNIDASNGVIHVIDAVLMP